MKDIFLSWIQWCGKWTQADLIMKKYPNKFKYFETWAILRALSSTDNAIWNYLRNTVETGWLVKDEVIVAIFNVFLQTVEPTDHLLLDWILRRSWQAKAICEKMKEYWREFIVINFDLDDETVYERLASRVVCAECGNNAIWGIVWWTCEHCNWKLIHRKDDASIGTIKKRIEAFHNETEPVLEWIDQQWRLVHIDAKQSINNIFNEVEKYI
jgi:adenylate kinase